jgi:hypothetical protein
MTRPASDPSPACVFDAVDQLLDRRSTPLQQLHSAEALHCALHGLAGSQSTSSASSEGPFGRALSPAEAARCLIDFQRTREFMLAVEEGLRRLDRSRPIRVLYVGSGPFASLILPLARRLDHMDLQIEAWDLHPDSADSVSRVRDMLGVSASRLQPRQADALTATPRLAGPPDLVIVETMQRALTREPQLALMARLGGMFPNAVFIPERIELRLVALNPNLEFDLDGKDRSRERIDLGWSPGYTPRQLAAHCRMVPSAHEMASVRLDERTIQIPELPDHCDQAAVLTRVVIDGQHALGDYDSAITQPLILSGLGRLLPDHRLDCAMRLGAQPGPEISWSKVD